MPLANESENDLAMLRGKLLSLLSTTSATVLACYNLQAI